MTKACLAVLAGMYSLQLSSFAVDSDPVRSLFVPGIALLAVRRLRLFALFFIGAGLFASTARDVVDSRIEARFVGDSILARVRIADFPRRDGGSISFLAIPISDVRLPARMRISWFEPPVELEAGDVWQLELRLRRPRGTSNTGVFDFEAWLTREHIGAVGYVVNGRRNHLLESGVPGRIDQLRQRFVRRVTTLQLESDHAAALAALVVGARHLVSDNQWDRYARSGTSHLMAISGLHIGLAAAGAYLLAGAVLAIVGWRGNHRVAGAVVSIIVAVLYALVSGLAVPSQRASLMISLAGAALVRRRQPSVKNILVIAALAVALLSPLATMAPGFKLSFAAVVVLLWTALRFDRSTRYPSFHPLQLARVLRQLGHMQLMLLLGLLPLTVLIFGRVAFAAVPVNLIVVPLFSFVTVPLALTGMVLDGPLRSPGNACLWLAAESIGLAELVIGAAESMRWASVDIPSIEGTAWLMVLAPVLWVALPPAWPGRYTAWLGLVALLMYAPQRPPPGCAAMHVLDVGQGLAVVAVTQQSVLLFDTGPAFPNGSSMARTVVLPFLSARGIRRIDRLVVSHADLDHAGGVAAIVAGVAVERLLSGEPLPPQAMPARRCQSGRNWRSDGVNFRFLHPPAEASYDGNDASCVLQIEAGDRRLLLTGDIERVVEQQLVSANALQSVDVVIVPHHGSRTSSSDPFVRTLRPAVAIVPAGFGNRWGFPKHEVVERWQSAGAEVFVTGMSGAVSLVLCEQALSLDAREHRREHRRIWHE